MNSSPKRFLLWLLLAVCGGTLWSHAHSPCVAAEARRPVSSVAYSPDGKLLAIAADRAVLLYDRPTQKVMSTLGPVENPINSLAFSPDSKRLAAAEGTSGEQGLVRIWTIGQAESRTIEGHEDSIYAVAFSPSGETLATASYDKLVMLWKAADGSPLQTLKHHTAAVFGLAFSPDGKFLATVSADSTVKIWSIESGQRLVTLTESTKGLTTVAFHPQGQELVSAGDDKTLRIYTWNGVTAQLKRSVSAHDTGVLNVVYSPTGELLYSAAEDGRIKCWNLSDLRERHLYEPLADWPQSLAISPDGKQLAAGRFDGKVTLFDALSPRVETELVVQNLASDRRPVALSAVGSTPQTTPSPAAPFWFAALLGQAEVKPTEAKPAAAVKPPEPPRLDAVSPRTVVRGKTVKVTCSGLRLGEAVRVRHRPEAVKVTLLPPVADKSNLRELTLEIPADLRPGPITLLLETPGGTTGTKSTYAVAFDQTGEKPVPLNGSEQAAGPAGMALDPKAVAAISGPMATGKVLSATLVKLPATLEGTIAARGEQDLWQFDLAEGQELAVQLLASGLGSSLAPKVTLFDSTGKAVALTNRSLQGQWVLGYRCSAAGPYLLQIEDRNYTGGGNHFYVAQVGSFPLVTSWFPLGLTIGDATQPVSAAGVPGSPEAGAAAAVNEPAREIFANGVNLGEQRVIRTTNGPGPQNQPVNTSLGPTFNQVIYQASQSPELVERTTNDRPEQAIELPVPGAISGRIALDDSTGEANRPQSDIDVYAFSARQGERLILEVQAARWGSTLDSQLEILGADGQRLQRATLRCVASTNTVLRDHDSKSKGIRLQAWDDFGINDFLLLGGEINRIQILPLGPDEDVKFFDQNGVRMGFLGSTPQAHALGSLAYKVELAAPGEKFPATGLPVLPLYWSNDDGGPEFGGDSRILFEAPAEGRYFVRVSDARSLSAPSSTYRLSIRPRQGDFRISMTPEHPNVPRGGRLPVTVNLDRLDGFDQAVDVQLNGLPPGITATATRILPEFFSGTIVLSAEESADTGVPADDAPRVELVGKALLNSGSPKAEPQELVRQSTPFGDRHLVRVTAPGDLKVTVEPAIAEISPGQELRFTVSIERLNGLTGRIPVDVLNLPHGLRVLDVGLNGVLITDQESSRSFVVKCDPWAPVGENLFFAAPRIEARQNERHSSAAIRLIVCPSKPEAGPGQ